MAVIQSQTAYFWDAPALIDYAARTKMKLFKLILMLIPVVILLLFFIIIRAFISYLSAV